MPQYQAGVAGPIPLEDGRVVTAEQGPFELEVSAPHDEDLVERGVIVLVGESAPEEPAAPAAPATTPPAAKAGNADSGGE
jgi:hypothetical protein